MILVRARGPIGVSGVSPTECLPRALPRPLALAMTRSARTGSARPILPLQSGPTGDTLLAKHTSANGAAPWGGEIPAAFDLRACKGVRASIAPSPLLRAPVREIAV